MLNSRIVKIVLLLLGGCLIGVLLSGLSVVVMHKTSSNEYCISCHTKHSLVPENPQFSHFNNRAGVMVKCVDCHIGPGVGNYLSAKMSGLKDAISYMAIKDFDSKEWIDQNREKLAGTALKHISDVKSETCIACHSKIKKDLPTSMDPLAREVHSYNNAKVEGEQKQCVYCHRGVAHEYKKEWAAGHSASLSAK